MVQNAHFGWFLVSSGLSNPTFLESHACKLQQGEAVSLAIDLYASMRCMHVFVAHTCVVNVDLRHVHE
jgi:hypothetical protein